MGLGSVKGDGGSTDMRRGQERTDSEKRCGEGCPPRRSLHSKGRCGLRYQGSECSNAGERSNFTLAINDAELQVHGGDGGGIRAKGKGKTKSKGHGRKSSIQQQESIPHDGNGKGKTMAKRKGNGKGLGQYMSVLNAVGKGQGRSKGAGGDAHRRSKQGTHPSTVEKPHTRSKLPHGGVLQIPCSPAMEEHRLNQLMVSLKTPGCAYRFTEYDWEYTCEHFFYRYNLTRSIAVDFSSAKFTFDDHVDARAAMTEFNGKVFNREGRVPATNWDDVEFVIRIEWAKRESQSSTPPAYASSTLPYTIRYNSSGAVHIQAARFQAFPESSLHEDISSPGEHGGDSGGIPPKGKGKTKSKGHGRTSSVQQQDAIPHKGKGKGKSMAKGKGNGKRIGKDMVALNVVGKGRGRSKGAGGDVQSIPVCAICQEDLKVAASEALDCMHAFHRGCALRCVPHIRRLGCPICRLRSPLWLRGLHWLDTDGSPISEAPPDSESEPEVASRFSSEQMDIHDHSNGMPQGSPNSDSDDDFWPGWNQEIDMLRDEFPDLDSDALGDLYDARIHDDCDEFGGYCSGGS